MQSRTAESKAASLDAKAADLQQQLTDSLNKVCRLTADLSDERSVTLPQCPLPVLSADAGACALQNSAVP